MKRTRSEQSLALLSSLGLSDPTSPASSAAHSPQQQQQYYTQYSNGEMPNFVGRPPVHPTGRGPWHSSLPPVISDHDCSSTNSLLSCDSDLTRSSQALQALAPAQPAAGQTQQQQQQQQRSSVSYLPAVGSASSLQHGALGSGSGFSAGSAGAAAAAARLFHTPSDSSDVAAGLFRAEQPRGYSLPPFISPAPAFARTQGDSSSSLSVGSGSVMHMLPPLRTTAAAAGPSAAAASPVLSTALDAGACAIQQQAAAARAAAAQPISWGMVGATAPAFASAAAAFGSGAAGSSSSLSAWGGGRGGRMGGLSLLRPELVIPATPTPTPSSIPVLQAAAAEPDVWDFSRRARAVREARKGSGSSSLGRRRSSIEATMPWRARLDDAIAAADASAPAARAPDMDGIHPEDGPSCAAMAELEALERAADEKRQQRSQDKQRAELMERRRRQQQAEETPLCIEAPSSGQSLASIMDGSDQRSSMESEGDGAGGSTASARRARMSGSGSEGGRSGDSPVAGGPRLGRPRQSNSGTYSGYYTRQNEGGAAFELFVRMNRARQTLGASSFSFVVVAQAFGVGF